MLHDLGRRMRLQYNDHLGLLVSASTRRQARRRATSRNRKPRLGSGLTMVRTSQCNEFFPRREAMAIGKKRRSGCLAPRLAAIKVDKLRPHGQKTTRLSPAT